MSRNRQLWGAETSKAVENFPISGETVPLEVVHWLARLKGAAAAVNGELGLLPKRTAGRTHLMDAVPVTLGQEFGGYSAQMALGSERVSAALVHVGQIPLGGTATGTGLNTHPRFAEKVRARLRKETGLKQIAAPLDAFEAQASRDALVELSGALRVVAVSLT